VNRKALSPAPKRRRGLLGWLFGDGGSPAPPRPVAQPSYSPEVEDDPGRAALRGLPANGHDVAEAAEPAAAPPPSRGGKPHIPREMFRVNVNLPANLDIAGERVVPVRITNISGTGAALLLEESDKLPPTGHWLDLALPNRQKALEIEVEVIHSRRHTGPQGQEQQIVHTRFPTIRRNEQDAIIAYINNIRIYEDRQVNVAAKVMLEVVTGRRRFAKFSGETIEIRPDVMRLMMDDFDAIVGSEVMLTIMAPHFVDHLDVEEVKVEKVDIIDPRHAEVEVSLAKPDDKILLFIRKHYPGVAKKR